MLSVIAPMHHICRVFRHTDRHRADNEADTLKILAAYSSGPIFVTVGIND